MHSWVKVLSIFPNQFMDEFSQNRLFLTNNWFYNPIATWSSNTRAAIRQNISRAKQNCGKVRCFRREIFLSHQPWFLTDIGTCFYGDKTGVVLCVSRAAKPDTRLHAGNYPKLMVLFLHILASRSRLIFRVSSQSAIRMISFLLRLKRYRGEVSYGFNIPRDKYPYQRLDRSISHSYCLSVFFGADWTI